MIDWNHYSQLLTAGSDTAIRAFLDQYPDIDLAAIGFTFELWNHSPAFSLCANTQQQIRQNLIADGPNANETAIRWNSGDFEFCAGLLPRKDELGTEWKSAYSRLHDYANQDSSSREVYDGLVCISCKALAQIVKSGTLDDWQKIDFNIAELWG